MSRLNRDPRELARIQNRTPPSNRFSRPLTPQETYVNVRNNRPTPQVSPIADIEEMALARIRFLRETQANEIERQFLRAARSRGFSYIFTRSSPLFSSFNSLPILSSTTERIENLIVDEHSNKILLVVPISSPYAVKNSIEVLEDINKTLSSETKYFHDSSETYTYFLEKEDIEKYPSIFSDKDLGSVIHILNINLKTLPDILKVKLFSIINLLPLWQL